MSQPSETSSPAVRQRPWTSASVGIGERLEPPHGGEQRLEAEIGAVAARIDDLLEAR